MNDNPTAAERACQKRPVIGPADVDEYSCAEYHPDAPYTPFIAFDAAGRHFEILDKDLDGEVDLVFSFGRGPEWCTTHSEIPADVIELVRERAGPFTLTIPDEFVGDAWPADHRAVFGGDE